MFAPYVKNKFGQYVSIHEGYSLPNPDRPKALTKSERAQKKTKRKQAREARRRNRS